MISHYALLADIGGTNARFALADLQAAAPLVLDSVRQFPVVQFPDVASAALHYLDSLPCTPPRRPHAGVFAVAGRIDGDEVRVTNHPWVISRHATQAELGLSCLRLVNDFAAQAMALQLLADADLVAVGGPGRRPPSSARQSYAVLGPGTGFGVSALIVNDGVAMALETEGGHASFAPVTAQEKAIMESLSARFGRVSNERLVSGGGLQNIHRALLDLHGETRPELRPQDITAGAGAGDVRCSETVEQFCAAFGAIAGDMVLCYGAWDGVFLTGGLVPKLLPQLQASQFRQRFEDKGRFATAMAAVPTLAVVHAHAGLLGAAAFALQDVAMMSPSVRIA